MSDKSDFARSSWNFENREHQSRIYILLITILAAILFIFCITQLKIDARACGALIILGVLTLVLEMSSVETPPSGYARITLPLYITLNILYSHAPITSAVAFIALISHTLIRNRQQFWNRILAFSASLLNIMVMSLLYNGINSDAGVLSGKNFAALIASLALYLVLDFLTMSAARGLIPEEALGNWNKTRIKMILFNVLIAPLGVFTATLLLYSEKCFWALISFLLPAAVLRFSVESITKEHTIKDQIIQESTIAKLQQNLQSERELNKEISADLSRIEEELTIYYELNQQLGGSPGLERTFNIILSMVLRLINCQSCVIFTFEKGSLVPRAISSPYKEALEMSALLKLEEKTVTEVVRTRQPLLSAEVDNPESSQRIFKDERSCMCVPLLVKNELTGVIYTGTTTGGYYNGYMLGQLITLAHFAAQAIFVALMHESEKSEKRRILSFFERYVNPEVVDEILKKSSEELGLKGERKKVTVMFLDVRRFTDLSESMAPHILISRLNRLWADLGEIIYSYGGTLLAYMGDALLAVFGAPIAHRNDSIRAVTAAFLMQEKMDVMRELWKKEGSQALHIGIGINTGEVIAGDVGFSKHREYTVMGETVNIAARLEKLNKEYSTKIIISESTYLEVQQHCKARFIDSVTLRGKSVPTRIYELQEIKRYSATELQ